MTETVTSVSHVRNDAERLEKPFETYTAMTTEAGAQ